MTLFDAGVVLIVLFTWLGKELHLEPDYTKLSVTLMDIKEDLVVNKLSLAEVAIRQVTIDFLILLFTPRRMR